MSSLNTLQELIQSSYGLVARNNWKNNIEQAVQVQSEKRNISKQEYIELAIQDSFVLQELAGHLTVEESFFFRHVEHTQAFIDYIRRRLSPTQDDGQIIIWSAGCSNGQEPYSIAMILKEHFTDSECARISIIASDLSEAAISNAKAGIYPQWSLRVVHDPHRHRFFKELDANQYEISKDIRAMVDFRCLSVQEHGRQFAMSSIDCLFFRNVAIYLSSQAQLQICRLFSRILCTQGVLFLGPSDLMPTQGLFAWLDNDSASVLIHSKKYSTMDSHQLQHKRSRIPNLPLRFASKIPKPKIKRPRAQPLSASERAQRALSLANSNNFTEAISASNALIEQQPHNKLGHLIRGQIHLAANDFEKAMCDLRRAIFIDPDDTVVRFWYAYALQKCGATRRSLLQINGLLSQLSALRNHTLLEDGHTTAGELLSAARQIKECLT